MKRLSCVFLALMCCLGSFAAYAEDEASEYADYSIAELRKMIYEAQYAIEDLQEMIYEARYEIRKRRHDDTESTAVFDQFMVNMENLGYDLVLTKLVHAEGAPSATHTLEDLSLSEIPGRHLQFRYDIDSFGVQVNREFSKEYILDSFTALLLAVSQVDGTDAWATEDAAREYLDQVFALHHEAMREGELISLNYMGYDFNFVYSEYGNYGYLLNIV